MKEKKNKRRGCPVGNKKTDTVNANKENDEESCAKRLKGEFDMTAYCLLG